MRRDNRAEKNVKKKRRRKKRYLLKIFLFLLLCAGVYFGVHIDYFTVDGIAVVGNEDISDDEILKLSELKTGENIFDVHPLFAQHRIKQNLYIEKVRVKRKLPNKIEISVTERSGQAQFLMGKRFVITDGEGMVLDIAKEQKEVPLVENVKVTKAEKKKTIEVKDGDTYDKAMEIIQRMEDGDLYFKKLDIDGTRVNAYIYDGLVCRGKYTDLLNCMKSGALKTVVFDLYQKGVEAGVINIGSNNYCSFTPQN